MGNAENKRDLRRIGDEEIDKALATRNEVDQQDLRLLQTDYDKIHRSYIDPSYQLSEGLETKKNRWIWARTHKEENPSIRSKRHLAKAIMEEFKVSQTTAYDDILHMERLFATLDQINVDFEWIAQYETTQRQLQVAIELGPKGIKVVPALLKQLNELLKQKSEASREINPTTVTIQCMDNPELVGGRRIRNLDEKVEAAINRAKMAAQRRFEDVNFEVI